MLSSNKKGKDKFWAVFQFHQCVSAPLPANSLTFCMPLNAFVSWFPFFAEDKNNEFL